FFLTREADAMTQIAELLPKGTVLMTGSMRAPDGPPGARVSRAYNSIYVIDHDGSVLSVYDKLPLVTFREYLPFQEWMARLGLGIEGVLDASLPSALPPTVYARLGDIPAAIIVAAALLFIVRRRAAKQAA